MCPIFLETNHDTKWKPLRGRRLKMPRHVPRGRQTKLTNLKNKYENVNFEKEKGRRYVPCMVRNVLKQMRVRLIQHSFYTFVSKESEFEVEKWGKLYGELKQNVSTCQKMSSGRCARIVRNGAQRFFPGGKGTDGAQIDKMQFWAFRKGLSGGK